MKKKGPDTKNPATFQGSPGPEERQKKQSLQVQPGKTPWETQKEKKPFKREALFEIITKKKNLKSAYIKTPTLGGKGG